MLILISIFMPQHLLPSPLAALLPKYKLKTQLSVAPDPGWNGPSYEAPDIIPSPTSPLLFLGFLRWSIVYNLA